MIKTLLMLLISIVLFGCNSSNKIYYINTRIIYEDGINYNYIYRDIDCFNKLLEESRIQLLPFTQDSISFDGCDGINWFDLIESNSSIYNDTLNIYIVSLNNKHSVNGFRMPAGLSVFPEENKNYVMLVAEYIDQYTMSHEILHWGGLRHVFDPNENIKDTPIQSGANIDNCNIMDYSLLRTRCVTIGQIEEFRKNVILYRKNQLR